MVWVTVKAEGFTQRRREEKRGAEIVALAAQPPY